MAQMNVAQFAKELGLASAMLLEQLQAAGIGKSLADDTVLTEHDKTQFLDYLRRVHGAKDTKNKITLTRRQTSEIKKSDSTGKARTIQVEVKKKRVLVKRDTASENADNVVHDVELRLLLARCTGLASQCQCRTNGTQGGRGTQTGRIDCPANRRSSAEATAQAQIHQRSRTPVLQAVNQPPLRQSPKLRKSPRK